MPALVVAGQRPRGSVDQRHTFAYAFAAVEPLTGRDFCLLLPVVSTTAMNEFLRQFAAGLPADEHALMVLDGAGWHTSHDLVVPSNVTLLRLPPYTPELNPVERVWLYLRDAISRTVFTRTTTRSSMKSPQLGVS